MGAVECAKATVASVVAAGVTDFVVCPGSRSAPLTLAIAELAADAGVPVHVRVDERSAGFFALGIGKAGGLAAVVTTSGTAVGNLLPAVMEAFHGQVPLLVLSADRPADLVGTGANQTTHQVGLFSVFASCFRVTSESDAEQVADTARDAVSAAVTGAGPVQVNVELRPPLVGEGPYCFSPSWDLSGSLEQRERPVLEVVPSRTFAPKLEIGAFPIVICGDGADGAVAVPFAALIGAPLVAEPSTTARPDALVLGADLLGTVLSERVDHAIVFGHPTLYRSVVQLLSRPGVRVSLVGDVPGPGCPVDDRFEVVPTAVGRGTDGWVSGWRSAEAWLGAELCHEDGPAVARGEQVAAAVCSGLGVGDVLVVGPSSPVRDLGRVPMPRGVSCLANRGLAGIDGIVSTALGVASRRERTTLYCGDLTFIHDSNGLQIGLAERRPNLSIVVADDRGGSIFAGLEYGGPEFAPVFERFFATPPDVDVVELARSYGVGAERVTDLVGLGDKLRSQTSGTFVYVVDVDRGSRRSEAQSRAKVAAQAAELALKSAGSRL